MSATRRQAATLTMWMLCITACSPSSNAPPAGNPAAHAADDATRPTLSLKEYASHSAAQNRAITLSVTAFRAVEKLGPDYPQPRHLWLIVDGQWARQANASPEVGAPMSLGDRFFLLVNGEQRCDPIERQGDGTAGHWLPTRDMEIPAVNAPPAVGQYLFQIPDQGIHSLELISSDAAFGDMRLALFGARPAPAPPIAPSIRAGNVALDLLGVREVDALGDAYTGEDSRYLVVDLRLRNTSVVSTATLDPNDGWQVSDSIGDQYPVVALESLDGRFLSPTTLLPSMAQRGIVVFQVPYHHYALTLTALAGDKSPLRIALPGTGTEPAPAGPPLSRFTDGNGMTVSILSVGRTGTLAPNLEPADSVIETAGGNGHANRYLILEAQFESSSATDTQVKEEQFTLIHGSSEARTSSHDLNALPSQLGNTAEGIVPAHASRRYYFAFAVAPDWWDDLRIRYHGANGDKDIPVPKVVLSPSAPGGAQAAVNVADADIGGEIDNLTATYGSGFTGRDLLRASPTEAWTPENGVQFPFDITLSFYARSSVLISAVELVLPNDPRSAPREVEVWSAMESSPKAYAKLASASLVPDHQVQRISFSPVESRFVKLRILSANGGPFALELSGIRVLETSGSGYKPLQQRFAETADWVLSPRRAAQTGLDWLQASTIRWQISHRCFGCHVQGQTTMGLAVARRNEYVVSDPLIDRLSAYSAAQQLLNGPDRGSLPVPDASATILPTIFAAMSYSYLERGHNASVDGGLADAATWLLSKQAPSGELISEVSDSSAASGSAAMANSRPIAQGSIMASANAAFAFSEAFTQTRDARFEGATSNAVAFIESAPPITTQDTVFKILALERFGNAKQKATAAALAASLAAQEEAEGGWKESPDLEGANPFATGQALYALKQAGVAVDSAPFRSGVEYLLRNQQPLGDWQPLSTHSPSHTPFAPTMWAVIGLAGAFHASTAEGEPPPTLERKFKSEVDSTGRFVLRVNFDFDKATLRPDALPIIDQVAALLRHRPDWQFDINGYTDNVGTDQHNQRLSEERAHEVLGALLARHVEARRLSSSGFGKSAAVASNDTEQGRFQNRRVEFVKR